MKFEFIGKTKAKLTGIDIQSKKDGQTDLRPAIALTFKVVQPNDTLNMLGARIRKFFYEKTNKEKEVQGTLDGVPMVSELAQLTDEGKLLGGQSCGKWEQTGCTLELYQGVSGHGDITLRDGTVSKVSFFCKEGGAVEWQYDFYTTDIDAETIGELGVLKSHDLDHELLLPELISKKQKNLAPVEAPTTPTTPFDALEESAGKPASTGPVDAWPFPNAAPTENNTVVTIKPPRRGKLGTDAEQAARQRAVLDAADTQAAAT